MFKKKYRFTVAIVIFDAVMLLAAGIFVLLFVSEKNNLEEIIGPANMGFISLGIIILNTIINLVAMFIFDHQREVSDIKMAEVIGSDIKEAYLFSKVGLIVVNEEGVVVWTSDLIYQRGINIIGKSIYEWQPKLRSFQEQGFNSETIKITVSNQTYKAKFLKSAGLFILQDITDYEDVLTYSKEQATCLGIVMIDNYLEIVGGGDDASETVTEVKTIITNYFRKYGCLIRSYRGDGYFVVCNFVSLDQMKKDGFSVLDEVRDIKAKELIHPTISIGFAHEFPDVNKLNDMASSAIDIAMSRGGDQACVSRYGSDLEFFGGRTEAAESGSKVKLRVVADSLINLISSSENVLIMGHTDADMDAIGACFGIRALCKTLGVKSKIVFDHKLVERKARQAVVSLFERQEINEFSISLKAAIDSCEKDTLVVLVDVSKPNMAICPEILEKSEKVVVIDHHRRSQEFVENPILFYIEPAASSSCEIIAQMFKFNSLGKKIEISDKYASIMLSGIFLDTQYYRTKTTGIGTFDASMILKEYGADNYIADDLLKDDFEEYQLINRILSTMKNPYYAVSYCVCSNDEIIEAATLAKACNKAASFKTISAAFVIGRVDEETIKISARSNGTVNVQLLMEKMGGGGHYSMAAASFKETDVSKVEKLLLETLNQNLSDVRSEEGKDD